MLGEAAMVRLGRRPAWSSRTKLNAKSPRPEVFLFTRLNVNLVLAEAIRPDGRESGFR